MKVDDSQFMKTVAKIVDRREQAKNFKLHCPVCQTVQVQLVGWSFDAVWKFKCRHCKSEWTINLTSERTPKGLPKK